MTVISQYLLLRICSSLVLSCLVLSCLCTHSMSHSIISAFQCFVTFSTFQHSTFSTTSETYTSPHCISVSIKVPGFISPTSMFVLDRHFGIEVNDRFPHRWLNILHIAFLSMSSNHHVRLHLARHSPPSVKKAPVKPLRSAPSSRTPVNPNITIRLAKSTKHCKDQDQDIYQDDDDDMASSFLQFW